MVGQLRPSLQFQEMFGQIERPSLAYQILGLSKSFDWSHSIGDMLGITTSIRNQHFPTAFFDGSYFESEAFQAAARLDDISRMAERLRLDLRSNIPAHADLGEQMQRAGLGGLAAREFSNRHLGLVSPGLPALESTIKSIESLASRFRDIDLNGFKPADDLLIKEAQGQVESVSTTAERASDLQSAVDQIVAAIATQHKPQIQFALWIYFRPLIWCIVSATVTALVTIAVNNYMASSQEPASPREITKHVKEIVHAAGTTSNMLDELRYISAKTVFIRLNPRAKSPALGELKLGTVVRIVKQQKDFALILWQDNESGAQIQGWVFARYLGKFN